MRTQNYSDDQAETAPLLLSEEKENNSLDIQVERSYEKILTIESTDIWFSIFQFIDLESLSLFALTPKGRSIALRSLPDVTEFPRLMRLGLLSQLNEVFGNLKPQLSAAEKQAEKKEVRNGVYKSQLCRLVPTMTFGGIIVGLVFLIKDMVSNKQNFNAAKNAEYNAFDTLENRCQVTQIAKGNFYLPCDNSCCNSTVLLEDCHYNYPTCFDIVHAMIQCNESIYDIFSQQCDIKMDYDRPLSGEIVGTVFIGAFAFFLLFLFLTFLKFLFQADYWKDPVRVDLLKPVTPLLTDETLSSADQFILKYYALRDVNHKIKFTEIRLKLDAVKARTEALFERVITRLQLQPTALENECRLIFIKTLERIIHLTSIEERDRNALTHEYKEQVTIKIDLPKRSEQVSSTKLLLLQLMKNEKSLEEKDLTLAEDLLSWVAPDSTAKQKEKNEIHLLDKDLFQIRRSFTSMNDQKRMITSLRPISEKLSYSLFCSKRSQPEIRRTIPNLPPSATM